MHKIRNITSFIIAAILCLTILELPCAAASNDNTERSILIMDSLNQNNLWKKNIMETIYNSLDSSELNVKTSIDHIDLKDPSDTKYYRLLSDFYKKKYAGFKFDIVVVCDNAAFDFIIKYHDKIFSDTPIVFCGVSNFDDDKIKNEKNITGVVQDVCIKDTINFAFKLQSDIREIYIVGDEASIGKELKETINGIINDYKNKIKIIWDKHSNIEDAAAYSENAGKGSAIFLAAGCTKNNGEYMDISKCASRISKVSNVPVYSFSGDCLGQGAIGGIISTGRYQGNKAAEIILRILEGEKVPDIKVVKVQPDTYILDYLQLKKYNLNKKKFSGNYKIINPPSLFYSVSKRTLWILSLTVIIILLGLIVLLFRHIKFRIKAEKKLKENEERLRTLINAAPDIICFKDGDGKWIEANEFCLKILRITELDYRGRTDAELGERFGNLNHWCSVFKERDMAAWTKKETMRYEEIIPCDEGEPKIFDIIIVPLFYSDGSRKGIVVFGRDITEKKKNEESKRLLNEAMEFDKLKTEFFANISHELRTPLNVMLSTLQLLELYIDNGSIIDNGSNLERNIYILKQNSLRLLRLVNNLIDITKIDSGYFELQLQNSDIVSTVEDITLSVKEYVESKNISLIFDTDVEEKVIACDSDKIERIMLNLLSNAIKFTKSGGNISVNLYDGTEYIRIEVSDTGIGIPKEKQNIIFERFRQIDKSFARSNEGSGIGLSLVKSLVIMHGGNIKVESEYGKGSKFIIELPVKLISEEDGLNIRSIDLKDSQNKINLEFSDIY